MPLVFRPVVLSALVLAALLPAMASAELLKVGGTRRDEVHTAVAAHRAAERAQISSDEAAAGRRLTPAERAELREQVRSQWSLRSDATQTADSAAAPADQPATAGGGWRAFWPWASPRQ